MFEFEKKLLGEFVQDMPHIHKSCSGKQSCLRQDKNKYGMHRSEGPTYIILV